MRQVRRIGSCREGSIKVGSARVPESHGPSQPQRQSANAAQSAGDRQANRGQIMPDKIAERTDPTGPGHEGHGMVPLRRGVVSSRRPLKCGSSRDHEQFLRNAADGSGRGRFLRTQMGEYRPFPAGSSESKQRWQGVLTGNFPRRSVADEHHLETRCGMSRGMIRDSWSHSITLRIF